MRKRFLKLLVKVSSLLVVSAVLLQSPAVLIHAATKAAQQQDTTISKNTSSAATAQPSNVVDGQTIDDRDTVDTNLFLSSDAGGAAYLNTLQSRGIDPFSVRYVRVGTAAGNTSATDGLLLLTQKLNEVVAKCGGPKVVSTEAWVGGASTASGAPEGGLLFVANLETGERTLVAALNANDKSMSGAEDPVVNGGNFFGGDAAAAVACVPIVAIIICWIRCIIFKQIIILIRCIVINIIACVRVGWTIVCFRARIVCCAILVFIRIIIICFIDCIVIYIGANQAAPPGATDNVVGRNLPKARQSLASAAASLRRGFAPNPRQLGYQYHG